MEPHEVIEKSITDRHKEKNKITDKAEIKNDFNDMRDL
jgi:hypothetical protein